MSREIKLLSWIFYAAAVALLINVSVNAYFGLMPMSHWVKYYDVIPARERFDVDQKLKFISDLEVNRKSKLEFNDILFCRDPLSGDFERYSSQRTARMHAIPKERHCTSWPYSPGVPFPTECYLESNVRLTLPFGLDKTTQVIGKPFFIVE